MTGSDTTLLVRILVGCVGDVVPDTGSIIAVTPEVADDLVRAGDAHRVEDDKPQGRGGSRRQPSIRGNRAAAALAQRAPRLKLESG